MGTLRFGASACLAASVALWLSAGPIAGHGVEGETPQALGSKQFVYADFERVENGRVVSNNGGLVYLHAYAENQTMLPAFKGVEGLDPPGPELVRVKPDDPNRLAKFDFDIKPPNQYAGIVLEVVGHPRTEGGEYVPDDVREYKTLAMQVFATGIETMRFEVKSRGFGMDRPLDQGWPQVSFKPSQGLNTYRIPLRTFGQPSWVTDTRYDPKDLLEKLTSVAVTAYCDSCRHMTGMVIVDNVVFEK